MSMLAPTQRQITAFHTKYLITEGCWEWQGYKRPDGYGMTRMTRDDGTTNTTTIQQASYTIHKGAVPEGMCVDHICRNPGCVNPDHLRLATYKQNSENRGANKRSRTGLRGVTWHKGDQRWHARVIHNGRMYRLGSFTTSSEAEQAVIAKRNELYTHNDVDKIAS